MSESMWASASGPSWRLDEPGQRVVEPADVQLDVRRHLGHALAAEGAGVHRVAAPGLGEPVEGVESVDRPLRVEASDVVDRAARAHPELEVQPVEAGVLRRHRQHGVRVLADQRLGHVGLDVLDRLGERVLEECVVGMPLVRVVVVAVVRAHARRHDRADDAIETTTELLFRFIAMFPLMSTA